MKLVCPKEINERIKSGENLVILDIREDYELSICGIEALHIPMEDVQSRITEVPMDKDLIVMCRSGKRAEALANLLETDFEFKNVSVLEGGIMGWKDLVDSNLEAY